MTVNQEANGRADVRADITAIVLPQSPAGTLTVGQLPHDEGPQGAGAADDARPQGRNPYVSKGPKAVAAVTLKIHF
ncbi:MAG: hypothetical protein KGL74_09855 [Elusimicrobia bacterium]|nr:hypothetical protein [Elusimicrobiota bacterium]MDE2511415.1 hypothetical protein [Elusimicrobiota bacterium]